MLDFDALMSGRRRGPSAAVTRAALWGASLGYRAAVAIRNRRYDRGSGVQSVDVPVICVGNLTTGGTGKTPVVCKLAGDLRERGIRVAIVSRGYGRGDAGVNDEAMELYERLPDVPHVQDADRVSAANIAIEQLESQMIVMDDGFGHRRLSRDANIVLIDATRPWGYGHLLPRGLLREPLSSLRRAAMVMVTRCDLVDATRLDAIEATTRQHFDGPILRSTHRVGGWIDARGDRGPVSELANRRVALLSAIGNPTAFAATVKTLGCEIISHRILPDHDAMDPDSMLATRQWAEQQSADLVLCTHKDLVKLRTDRLGGKPLRAIQIDLSLDDPAGHWQTLLDRVTATIS